MPNLVNLVKDTSSYNQTYQTILQDFTVDNVTYKYPFGWGTPGGGNYLYALASVWYRDDVLFQENPAMQFTDAMWDTSRMEYYYFPVFATFAEGKKYGQGLAYDASEIVRGTPYPFIPSGGAGSGYIGNSLLSNKKMVGYDVPTSDATNTKTESVNVASEVPIPDTPKIGNGHVKIRLINTLPDTLVLYDNGRVNSQYFDTDAEVIGHTQDEPLSYDYQVKSDHLEISYDNWRDTIYWRGVQVNFNKKKVPLGYYHRIRIDAELYCKYNSSWASIYFKSIVDNEEHDNGRLLQYYNGGTNIYHEVVTSGSDACDRYVIRGASSFEATDRWVSEDVFNSDCVKLMLEGVNQYHKATLKIYKITLIHDPIPEGFEYIRNINQLWVGYNNDLDNHVNFFEYTDTFREVDYQDQTYSDKNPKLYTFYGTYLVNTINGVTQNNHDENYQTNADQRPLKVASLNGIMTISVDTSIPSSVHVTYSLGYDDRVDFVGYRPQDYLVFYAKDSDDMLHFYYTYEGGLPMQDYFSSLSDAIAYIYDNYANINLYVDGVMWVKALS